MNVGYINPKVRAMYGIPYSQLTAQQKRILHEDSERRAKLIKEREDDVLKNDRKAFDDEAKMERVLASLYKDCQKQILARVAETIAKVEKAGGEWSYANQSALTRSKGLFEQINEQIKILGQKEEITFRQGLGNIYTDQFLRELYSMGQVQNVKVNFNSLNPTYIKKAIDYPWSGAMFSDRLWIDKENLGRNLRLGLTQSMVLGEGIPQITERINKNINTSQYNAERVARTETVRVSYVAKSEIWEQNGVEQLRYRSANGGDSRACSTCKADNGKVFDKGTEPTLPRHPNCRCTYIPVAKDTFGDNELNELTGSVRGAENYDKWKKEYEVALNPDGSYKDGWGRDKDFKVKYTTKDGRKLTLDEYKAEFVDKPVNPTPVKGGVTVEAVKKEAKDVIAREPIKLTDFPQPFYATKAEAKNTQVLIDYLNNAEVSDAELLALYRSMDSLSDRLSKDIIFKVTHRAHRIDRGYNKKYEYILDVGIPKADTNYIGTINTCLHEEMHLLDILVYMDKDKKGKGYPKGLFSQNYKPLIEAFENTTPKIGERAKKLFDDFKAESEAIAEKYSKEFKVKASKLNDDYHNGKMSYNEYSKEYKKAYKNAIECMDKETRSLYGGGVSGLQDIYDAISKGKFYDNHTVLYGHGAKYYQDKKRTHPYCSESLANYSSICLTNPELIDILAEDYPEVVTALRACVTDMIKEAIK